MSLNTRTAAAWLGAALRFGVPATALLTTAAGCSFIQGNQKTHVADGTLYEPGSDDYDAFFKELYDVQLLMGQAPDRDTATRGKVAETLGLEATAPTDKIGDALYERAATLAKAGVSLKLSLEGLNEGNPSATVVTIGEVKDAKDQKLVDALDQAVKDEAQLLADLRKARSPLERLRGQAAALEPRIDSSFERMSKRKEVRKNLDDARQLVPLMVARGDDVHRQASYFLKTLQKVLGAPTSVAGPTAPEEPTPPPKKAGKGKAKPDKPRMTKPASPQRSVPAPKATPKPAEPPKAEPKKEPKKVAQDFEP